MIELSLGATPHDLTLTEARLLQTMLSERRSFGGVVLGRTVREAVEAESPSPIRLGLNDIRALRRVLSGMNVGGFPGLLGLQAALCEPV